MDPASYELACALRTQFEMVKEAGVREYARAHNLDPATVSRSLKCTAVPTWEFIKELAWHAAADQYGRPPSNETLSRLFELHQKLVAANTQSRGHVVQKLRAEVTRAQLEIAHRDQRVRALTAELEEVTRTNFELNSQVRALESGRIRPLNTGGANLVMRDGAKLRMERESAENIIADLRLEVEQERHLKELAEQRCKDYQAILAEIVAMEEAAFKRSEPVTVFIQSDPSDAPESDSRGHRVAIDPSHRYSAALVESLRSEIAEKDGRILELENRLNMSRHEVGSGDSESLVRSDSDEEFLIDQWGVSGRTENRRAY